MLDIGSYKFDIPKKDQKSIIKVIGVGGGGSNAVTTMYNKGIRDVEFVVCNTDAQALKGTPVPNKLQIGLNLTEGLGAGANPEVGKNAALESKDDIKALLDDGTKMIFITAGMGGGTGTGAAPVIASVSKKLGILTVGIVTLPFSFEGKKKKQRAEEGIKELKEHCDTVLVILNDRLQEVLGNLTIGKAFEQADNVLTTGAKSIAEIITVPGYVNVDFEDVKTVIKDAGAAVMGSGVADGEQRALKAAQQALTSPLLDYKDIKGAQKILLSIVSGPESELQMDELSQITDYIQDEVGIDSEIIFGHGSDEQLGDKIRVTVIATGFEEKKYQKKEINFDSNKFSYYKNDSQKTSVEYSQKYMDRESKVISQKSLFDTQKTLVDSLNSQSILNHNSTKDKYKIPTFIRKKINLELDVDNKKKIKKIDLYENEEIESSN